MACTLSQTGITTGCTILATQVSQSISAFTKEEAYDIVLSGSLIVSGSTEFSSSDGTMIIKGLPRNTQTSVLTYNCTTGNVTFACCSCFTAPSADGPYKVGTACDISPRCGFSLTGNKAFAGIGSGQCNQIQSEYSYIGGGECNSILSATSACSIIGGGNNNSIQVAESAIIGGRENEIRCDGLSGPTNSTILGGCLNSIKRCGGWFLSFGCKNTITCGPGSYSSILNGSCNTIGGGTTGCA